MPLNRFRAAIVQQEAQTSTSETAGPVNAIAEAKKRIEEKAYASRIVAEHESMMAGQDWIVTGRGWTPGAAVTVTLKSADGGLVGVPVNATANADGRFDSVITIPEGTVTGTYSLEAAAAALSTRRQSTSSVARRSTPAIS